MSLAMNHCSPLMVTPSDAGDMGVEVEGGKRVAAKFVVRR